jgi:hypothetical protein
MHLKRKRMYIVSAMKRISNNKCGLLQLTKDADYEKENVSRRADDRYL